MFYKNDLHISHRISGNLEKLAQNPSATIILSNYLGRENPHPRTSATLHARLQGSYSRPEGAPALCDDPCELCQPPGIHLEPLQRVISPCAPGPVIEVIFIKATLQARNSRVEQNFIPDVHVETQTQSPCTVQCTDL